MATLTIRNLEESIKQSLRVRAANNNRSMEEEVRVILRQVLRGQDNGTGLGTMIMKRFGRTKGIDLSQPERREAPRKPEFPS